MSSSLGSHPSSSVNTQIYDKYNQGVPLLENKSVEISKLTLSKYKPLQVQ